MDYALYKYDDGKVKFYDIIGYGSYIEMRDQYCKLVKRGTYDELLHYCAENHIEFQPIKRYSYETIRKSLR